MLCGSFGNFRDDVGEGDVGAEAVGCLAGVVQGDLNIAGESGNDLGDEVKRKKTDLEVKRIFVLPRIQCIRSLGVYNIMWGICRPHHLCLVEKLLAC